MTTGSVELGDDVSSHDIAVADAVGVVRRTPTGWRVGNGHELPDLVSAMVLADLLTEEEGGERPRSQAPGRAPEGATEVERLRHTIAQLEHALHSRVVVEQAIGVLAERHTMPTREAFERLRSSARSRGRKVADLARDVVESSTSPLTVLPDELSVSPGANSN
ncbi:ANTAR domain-containing protein [Nocardiopsis sp. N85]|uniref:ANTAR domain-containing response regulator n=1 Tax=Nocardiopsis sp. N85 TaxID=3029400 RepID=UPI00237F6881|nr:ANTAR domain-containing protein [Nocardiopsis sp. N85]MDE3721080.1 ANTAR domain-containing protein [Nocardiopsis sp. N85]